MTVADTGVLLALLDEEHPRHRDAKALLQVGWVTVTAPTLAEVTRVIRRHGIHQGKDGNALARRALGVLRGLPGYRMSASVPEAEVAAAYDHDAALRYTDAWNLVASIRDGEPLATFDGALRRASGRRSAKR